MVAPEDVKRYIAENLDCQYLEVSGDGQHFQAVIVSEAFAASRGCNNINWCTEHWANACGKRSTPCRCKP